MQQKPDRPEKPSGDPLLQAALGSMPYGFSVWDESYRLVLFNRHYLQLYRLPEDRVRIGMTLRQMSELTVALGNHPGFTPEEIHGLIMQRLRSADEPSKNIRTQKPVHDRVIRASHIRLPAIGWIISHEDVTEEVALTGLTEAREAALTVQNLLFQATIENMPDGVSMYDAEKRLMVCNSRYLELYAIPTELAKPGTPFEAIMAQRRAAGTLPFDLGNDYADEVRGASRNKATHIQAYRLADGRVVAVTQSAMPQGGFVATHREITADIERFEALQENQHKLASQNLRFEAAVDNIGQGLCMFDAEMRLVICNAAYARIYALPPELTRPGVTLDAILDYRFVHGMVPAVGAERFREGRRALIAGKAATHEVIEMADGRAISIQYHPIADGGWVATHEDITDRRRSEARIRHLAQHDPLTDLPNRIYFREEMERAEQRIRRDETLAVLCIDLDYFKAVNDTQGHAVGDAVLRTVAERLRLASRETDVVARLGGDEFAILAGGLDGPQGAATVAARVVKALGDPMLLDGRQVMIGASVGIAIAPTDGTDAEALLKNADLALYRAKAEGRGNYHFFEKGMDQALEQRRALEQGLKLGFGRGEFRLVFQPLVSLADNRICCLEALLRWDHPERGTIDPVEFIPIAEETGMIVPIGEWVLREACKAATLWPEDVRVAVNLSVVQFKNRALVNQVTSALSEAGLPATRLELEITESLLLADSSATLETLHRLRALGVRIAMDDFGTGYSSLSYLRSFPFDKIKINRTFMNGLTPGTDSMAIIRAVIGLGQSLGMATTAEGIETEEQLAAVREQGCNEVQGFLFSPPLPAAGIAGLLDAWARPGRKARSKPRQAARPRIRRKS